MPNGVGVSSVGPDRSRPPSTARGPHTAHWPASDRDAPRRPGGLPPAPGPVVRPESRPRGRAGECRRVGPPSSAATYSGPEGNRRARRPRRPATLGCWTRERALRPEPIERFLIRAAHEQDLRTGRSRRVRARKTTPTIPPDLLQHFVGPNRRFVRAERMLTGQGTERVEDTIRRASAAKSPGSPLRSGSVPGTPPAEEPGPPRRR
jgi:hypothetical protein